MRKMEKLFIQKLERVLHKMIADESGMGVVEIAIIIIALIAVALLFQEKILEFVNTLFGLWII